MALPAAKALFTYLQQLLVPDKVMLVLPDIPRRWCDLNRMACRDTAYRRQLRHLVADSESHGRPVLLLDVHSFRDAHGRIGSVAGGAPLLLLDHCWPSSSPYAKHSATTQTLAKCLNHEQKSVPIVCTQLGDVRSEFSTGFQMPESRVISMEFNTDFAPDVWARRLASCLYNSILSPSPPPPLFSWNDGPVKTRLLDFIARTTNDSAHPDWVPPSERVAVFDLDGTLMIEQPQYLQFFFWCHKIRTRLVDAAFSKWRTVEPFQTVWSGTVEETSRLSIHDWISMLMQLFSDNERASTVKEVQPWLRTFVHPRWNTSYASLVYAPMRELLALVTDRGYRTYIVTGSEKSFVDVFCKEWFGVPADRVIGSRFTGHQRHPWLSVNGVEKRRAIEHVIGKRPQLAVGNSLGDREMLMYTQPCADTPHLSVLVHHTDGVREYAYGPAGHLRDSTIGHFPPSLYDHSLACKWSIVHMKTNWNRVF